MKCAVEIMSGGMMFIPNFMKMGPGVKTLLNT
jgi:hypothetical protein